MGEPTAANGPMVANGSTEALQRRTTGRVCVSKGPREGLSAASGPKRGRRTSRPIRRPTIARDPKPVPQQRANNLGAGSSSRPSKAVTAVSPTFQGCKVLPKTLALCTDLSPLVAPAFPLASRPTQRGPAIEPPQPGTEQPYVSHMPWRVQGLRQVASLHRSTTSECPRYQY